MHALINVLLVEDNPADAQLIDELCRDEPDCVLNIRRASSMKEAAEALVLARFDVVLQDLTLPDSTAAETLARAEQLAHEVPTIILTGLNDTVLAEKAVFHGIHDYLVKGRIDYNSLERSIRYAIERRRAMQEKDRLVAELQDALSHIKHLQGLLPICASCKKIRDYRGYWEEVEQYVHEHSDASFTHSICPDCIRRLYPELFVGKDIATPVEEVLAEHAR